MSKAARCSSTRSLTRMESYVDTPAQSCSHHSSIHTLKWAGFRNGIHSTF